jgi:DNA invertase Pin-like site-specific DNA recombinase
MSCLHVYSPSQKRHQSKIRRLLLDRVFTDKASGTDTARPQLTELLRFARDGDIVVVLSMDRLARNLDDLRALVQGLTRKGVRVEFVKESLVFTGEDSPMANLMLSVISAFAEFERSLIGKRRREDIALAQPRGAHKGGKRPSHRNGPPSWSSGPAAVFRKPSLLVTTGSAGRRYTQCATPRWGDGPHAVAEAAVLDEKSIIGVLKALGNRGSLLCDQHQRTKAGT